MELKNYQSEVLSDLSEYIDTLKEHKDLRKAYSLFWAKKGISVNNSDGEGYLHPYDNSVKNVPRITVKVPTAGGKTFIACNSLKSIFDKLPSQMPKVVAWFVPSDTILKQTYDNLSNPNHPYRQRIDSQFNGNVRIVDKESALFGIGISPTEVQEQLTIFVLSVQSFAVSKKDKRKVYNENENLVEYAKLYNTLTKRVEGADDSAFIQVLSFLNPVVIIDESHNFTANLRLEMLNDINPRFILELTATPKPNSNIISFVDAFKLKEEHMVKLPVIVYNNKSKEDVISSAIGLRNSLEARAKKQEEQGGRYIRPIVLFQAQPKTDNDSETFEKLKKSLIESGIPEDQIKIKTADKNELKRVDLMSKDCPVRYIITVNALKEGWDCPFAYILASVANRSSRVDVEQVLGRVLRLPYTSEHKEGLLNYSYVFTNSDNFNETIQIIIKGLNNVGFSKKDFRFSSYNEEKLFPSNLTEDLFGIEDSTSVEGQLPESEEEIDVATIKQRTISFANDNLEEIEAIATSKGEQYDAEVKAAKENKDDTPNELKDMQKYYSIKPIYEKVVNNLKLPVFVKKIETSDIFDSEGNKTVPITKKMLAEGFDLSKADRNITFTQTLPDARRIDLDKNNEYAPNAFIIKDSALQMYRETFIGLSKESKRNSLASTISRRLKYNEIAEKDIKSFICDVIKDADEEKLSDLYSFLPNTEQRIKEHIDKLLTGYEHQTFMNLLDLGTICCEPSYSFPKKITFMKPLVGISKGLYKEEYDDINDFEYKVLNDIANLDNVHFWHRNLERRGFCLNGFINHYPDFIVGLKSGKIILVETKGGDRDNTDSKMKLELGLRWANHAGDKYRYYMVFEKNPLKDALSVSQLLDKLKRL